MTLIVLNKPFGTMSQFSAHPSRATLADCVPVPDVYPAGRLDAESEGLLLLTDDGELQGRIADPRHKLAKTYLAQVERVPDTAALQRLRAGVDLGDFVTLPAEVRLIDEPDFLWQRQPPVRYRAEIPTQWLELTIREGKNRQVRRMTAAVGFPTLRLVRVSIGLLDLRQLGLQPGEWREIALAALGLPPPARANPRQPGSRGRGGSVEAARRTAPGRTGSPRRPGPPAPTPGPRRRKAG